MSDAHDDSPSISSLPNGPLLVQGDVNLVRKTPVHSEHGEPLAWKTGEPISRLVAPLRRYATSEETNFVVEDKQGMIETLAERPSPTPATTTGLLFKSRARSSEVIT